MMFVVALLLGADPTAALPADVRRFVEDHASCEHWLGEDGYDAERARDIRAAVAASCPGIDRRRARLLRRYRAPSAARRRLMALVPLDQ